MIEYPVSALVLSQAAALIDKHGLRALDAIQLATALSVKATNQSGREVTFVCADDTLLDAARFEGFLTWNPS